MKKDYLEIERFSDDREISEQNIEEIVGLDEYIDNIGCIVERFKNTGNPKINHLLHEIKNQMAIIVGHKELQENFSKPFPESKIAIAKSRGKISNMILILYDKIPIKKTTEFRKYLFIDSYGKKEVDSHAKLFCSKKVIPDLIDTDAKNFLPKDEEIYTKLCNQDYNIMMVNLIKNAAESFDKKRSRIGLELRKEIVAEENKEVLSIKLTDNGCGIEKNDLNRIFEEEFSTKEKSDTIAFGRGYGLPIVKDIVQKAEGKIECTSKKSEGTCFSILLPIIS